VAVVALAADFGRVDRVEDDPKNALMAQRAGGRLQVRKPGRTGPDDEDRSVDRFRNKMRVGQTSRGRVDDHPVELGGGVAMRRFMRPDNRRADWFRCPRSSASACR
jgi:hypothetical protein